MDETIDSRLKRAAAVIQQAEVLLIGAGAGMGVDSGLPDFRGDAGFWKAYPAVYGRPFYEVANPRWFQVDPTFAWGFYGQRLNLYRQTVPHEGFQILRRWAERMPAGAFVYTSNVDGHFQKAGFPTDQVVECHGSIHHLQCQENCQGNIWQADDVALEIDESILRATTSLPRCPDCGLVARPNILMFGDAFWLTRRSDEQTERYADWCRRVRGKIMVAIELGAGMAIPTVRFECERRSTRLIRINPREANVPADGISLPLGALAALQQIDKYLGQTVF